MPTAPPLLLASKETGKRVVKALRYVLMALALTTSATGTVADSTIDDFSTDPSSRWRYVSDQVMGGVSDGKVAFEFAEGVGFVRLAGTVSTKNRGGFIQVRTPLPKGLPNDAQGLALTVRGNGERYYIHLRTTGTVLPWQYYQAAFETGAAWQEIRIPISAFRRSGRLLPDAVRPNAVRSVGIVAFGRDHDADVSVSRIGSY